MKNLEYQKLLLTLGSMGVLHSLRSLRSRPSVLPAISLDLRWHTRPAASLFPSSSMPLIFWSSLVWLTAFQSELPLIPTSNWGKGRTHLRWTTISTSSWWASSCTLRTLGQISVLLWIFSASLCTRHMRSIIKRPIGFSRTWRAAPGKVCCLLDALIWPSRSTPMLIFSGWWLTADPQPDRFSAALSIARVANRTKCPARVQKPSIALSRMGPRKVSGSVGYSASFASSMPAWFTLLRQQVGHCSC